MGSPTLPRVAQLRRAPLLQGGGWGFESLAADMPLKLSSAEQPPCKRTVVGSIPTWGSSSPRSPTRQRHPAQTREVRGSNPRGGTGRGGTRGFPTSLLVLRRAWIVGLPAGEAGLRPRGPHARVTAERIASLRCRPKVGRPAVTRRMLVRPQPSQLVPRSSNGRIFGSEPKDAWFESRSRS
jgi:hypothetical protein